MAARCPICRKPVAPDGADRPFCSTRCKNVDLGRWLNEEYRISTPVEPEAENGVAQDQVETDAELD
jgi:uncharacterized protein